MESCLNSGILWNISEDKLVYSGGDHPMCHQNSVKEALTFDSDADRFQYNAVTIKRLSILMTWVKSQLDISYDVEIIDHDVIR